MTEINEKTILVDLQRCIGCWTCSMACKVGNGLEDDDFRITVRNLKVSAGAGFIVALTGDIMTMPGLPKVPSAEKIDVDETGKISGLF